MIYGGRDCLALRERGRTGGRILTEWKETVRKSQKEQSAAGAKSLGELSRVKGEVPNDLNGGPDASAVTVAG